MRSKVEQLFVTATIDFLKLIQRFKKLAYNAVHTHTATTRPHSYRPDVDGLRAIAVLAVVLFHAFPKYLSGGFAGVDVFFVISGFLITGIIHKGLKRGDFEFSDFWARRIRRIFPALLTVTVTTLVIGWLYLLPAEFETLKSHVKWGLAFAANFKLNSEVGYFDVAAELKPLLHLWSLAIEEQFYLVWPVILWICFRQNLNMFSVTFALGFLSYQSRKYFGTSASESFYLPWTRFWELQAGALLALWNAEYATRFAELWNRFEKYVRPLVLSADASKKGHTTTSLVKSSISLVGVALVVWSCLSFTNSTPFPSRFTIYPVLGSTLIIAAGKDAWFNKWILSLRPMRFIGNISFPLYLWHWPILAFARIIMNEPSTHFVVFSLALTFALSILTYFGIEQKLRFDKSRLGWKVPILTATSLGMLLIVSLLELAPRSKNLIQNEDTKIAFKPSGGEFCAKEYPIELCQIKNENKEPTVALIGDSHASHFFPGLAKRLESENVLLVAKSGTPPLLDVSSLRNPVSSLSSELVKIIQTPSINTVVLSAFWGNYLEEKGIEVAGSYYKNKIRDDFDPLLKNQLQIFRVGFERTIKKLKESGKSVIIFGDIPSLSFRLSACTQRPGLARQFLHNCSFSRESSINKDRLSRETLEEIIRRNENVGFVNTLDLVCPGKNCSLLTENGEWLYSDEHHLSKFGSQYLLSLVETPNLLSQN